LAARLASLEEARALGRAAAAQNPGLPVLREAAAAAQGVRRAALAAERAVPARSRGRRFVASLPHQAVAAVAAGGLIAAAVVPQGQDAHADADLDAERAASTAVVAKDVVAPVGQSAPQLARVTGVVGGDAELHLLADETSGDYSKLPKAERKGLLSQPFSTVRITSPFGARPDPWGGSGTVGHIGQDYGIQCGTPVHVAAAGTVVQAESAGHSGLRVLVDHGNGLQTSYNHNSVLKVKVGDKVERGDVVSLSGTTGNSTGCHMHLEVLLDGEFVDPADWL